MKLRTTIRCRPDVAHRDRDHQPVDRQVAFRVDRLGVCQGQEVVQVPEEIAAGVRKAGEAQCVQPAPATKLEAGAIGILQNVVSDLPVPPVVAFAAALLKVADRGAK